MKESDAKTKHCPQRGIMNQIKLQTMASLAIASPMAKSIRSDMKEVADDNLQNCTGSECMMWVETDDENYPSDKNSDYASNAYVPAGYCGLITFNG